MMIYYFCCFGIDMFTGCDFTFQSFSSPLNQMQSRIWLMHWSLFIFFNHDNGRTQIIDLFNLDKYELSFSFLCVLVCVEFL